MADYEDLRKALGLVAQAGGHVSVDPDTVSQLLADHDRYRAALIEIDTLDPDDDLFKSGQQHLPPAFREISFPKVIQRVGTIVHDALHGPPVPVVDETWPRVNCKSCGAPFEDCTRSVLEDQRACCAECRMKDTHDDIRPPEAERRWECVLVPRLADADLGLQCYETDPDTDPAVHGDCGWRDR